MPWQIQTPIDTHTPAQCLQDAGKTSDDQSVLLAALGTHPRMPCDDDPPCRCVIIQDSERIAHATEEAIYRSAANRGILNPTSGTWGRMTKADFDIFFDAARVQRETGTNWMAHADDGPFFPARTYVGKPYPIVIDQ